MHTEIETEKFKKVLEIVSRVSTKHLTLPVLQCVYLEAGTNTLSVKATNLEIGIEDSVPATVKETGVVAVSAQTLLQTINLVTETSVTLTHTESTLIIQTKTSKTEIKTTPADEFPNIPRITSSSQEINGTLFAEGIKTTAFTASQSSIKPELGSIYIVQKKEHSLTFVATDSFRLMEKTIAQKNISLNDSILIPQKNALEIARVIEHNTEGVQLYINENQCAFEIGSLYITSRLTNGTFPDYQQIIPKEYITHTTLLTEDLLQALKKTNIFLNKFMQLTMSIEGGVMTLSSQSGEVGNTTETINISTEGEDITLNFNQRYIYESLGYIKDDSVVLHFAGIGRPMVLEGVHDHSMRYLVMPMNK
ncbi:DNA polymerase III subunit beta [bacterium]|nr:DNA polymerase III subunit beta [bacterium]